jgi:hypothetical protein
VDWTNIERCEPRETTARYSTVSRVPPRHIEIQPKKAPETNDASATSQHGYDSLMARHHRRNTQNNMDRATEFLTGKPGLNFCDECVREALGTTHANLTEKDLHTNAVSVGLKRAPGLCSSCGKQRIVTRTP